MHRVFASATFHNVMVLVRNRNGTLYFLARDESYALDSLGKSYPGRPLAVVMKGDGLVILRVGEPLPTTDGHRGEPLAIVNLALPPAPASVSFRG